MNIDTPIVSVIIPVYNSGKVLERTVQSVLRQTLPDFELILIDDGSSDKETINLVDELGRSDSRIRVSHQTNSGVYAACDAGMAIARGKYVYVSGQDDYLHPQLFEIGSDICEKEGLDYLALRWKKNDINTTPACPEYSKSELKFDVVDNCSGDSENFIKFIGRVHIDAWAQFLTRELSLRFPSKKWGQSWRTFKCVYGAKRWGVLYNEMFYYSVNNGTSIMHKPIYADWVDELHVEFANVYDMAYAPESDPIGRSKFEAMAKLHIAKGVKTVFKMVRDSDYCGNKMARREAWRALSRMVADFLFCRKLRPRHVGIRRYLEYLLIALIWGGFRFCKVEKVVFHGSSTRIV